MDNRYFFVSGAATALEHVGVYANQGIHRTLVHVTRRIFGTLYKRTYDLPVFHYIFGFAHKQINLTISRFYRSKQIELESLEKYLTAIQKKTEKKLKARGIEYDDWTFSSENRKTIRRIFQFIDENIGLIKEIPISFKYLCIEQYIHLQDSFRKTAEKTEVIDVPEGLCLEELAVYSRHATGIYGHFLGRMNVKKILRSYMTGKSNKEVHLIHSQLDEKDLLYYSECSKKYLPLFAIVKIGEDTLAVIIRGTSSAFDAISDLKSNYSDLKIGSVKGRVHTGIQKSALGVSQQLKKFISSYINKDNIKTISIAGHSLGAGCGGLLHLLTKSDSFYSRFSVKSFLFAPPPVMSANLNDLVKKEIISCVYSNDIVPRLSFGTIKDLCDSLGCIYTEGLKNITSFDQLSHKLTNEKLQVPGSVLQIFKKTLNIQNKFATTHFESENYFASFISNTFSEEIIFSSSMINDHKATGYQRSLEQLTLASPEPINNPNINKPK